MEIKYMVRPLTISIAMCTYNGERFIQEQLDSFLKQSRLPDELVVCDDGSQDMTISILEDFCRRAPFPVRIFINSANLGYSRNFEKAMSICRGDIIAFSDQDDVWKPQKLARFEHFFKERPKVGCVFCNASLVDEELKPLGRSVWDHYGFSFRSPRVFAPGEFRKILFKRSYILGSTLAIRAELRELLLPIPRFWAYDGWIPFLAGEIKDIAALPEELNNYRQHPSQCSGIKHIKLSERLLQSRNDTRAYFSMLANIWVSTLSHLSSYTGLMKNENLMRDIDENIKHLNVRAGLPESRLRRIPYVLEEIINGHYQRYSNGCRSIIKDMLLP